MGKSLRKSCNGRSMAHTSAFLPNFCILTLLLAIDDDEEPDVLRFTSEEDAVSLAVSAVWRVSHSVKHTSPLCTRTSIKDSKLDNTHKDDTYPDSNPLAVEPLYQYQALSARKVERHWTGCDDGVVEEAP